MLSFKKIFIKLSKQFLPTGSSFRASEGSNQEGLFKALAVSEAQVRKDINSTFDSLIPDNDNFSSDDATDWERRLGLFSNSSVPLSVRKKAILRKMAAPGRNPAKGHYLWFQQQLRDAGFDVYVYENIFPLYPSGFVTQNPSDINPAILGTIQQGDCQQGDCQQGGFINHLIVNSLKNSVDVGFNTGENLRSTFFIGGSPLGTYAVLPANREKEFRHLVLTLKQTQTVAILFIQYI